MALLLVSSAGCQSETLLVELDSGPADPVSYSSQIAPIFQTSCGGASCHVGQSTSGVDLSNYSASLSSFGTLYKSLVILPGNAAESPLADKIFGSTSNGSPMPLNGQRLSASQVALIRSWIDQGAIDN